MSDNNGGPAFPCSVRRDENYMDFGGYGRTRTVTLQEGGMTLRDWFAGQALAGMIRANHRLEFTPPDDATWAYQIADAMLAERAKHESQ